MRTTTRVLLLPGWLNSGPSHWQSRWELLHGDQRVEQSDWLWPRRGDWMARLEEVLLGDDTPAVLVAHSLGCHLVAAWAAHSAHHSRVQGALLVAPPDLEREDTPPQISNWRPIVRSRLPFASKLIYSVDDPYGSRQASLRLAQDWGSNSLSLGLAGHVNGDSGLGDWPAGRGWLQTWGA
jgi:uncharacterized protein